MMGAMNNHNSLMADAVINMGELSRNNLGELSCNNIGELYHN